MAAGVLSVCGSHAARTSAPPTSTTAASTTTTTVAPTTTVRPVVAATCPLTGLPAPGGKVPERPALAVKVENLPAARPQYGLGDADIIYEEPVEGGITRFIVIYQCHDAPRIEPVRSGRLIDPDILVQYGAHPLFAFAGAIDPVVAKVNASPLINLSVDEAPNAYYHDPNRYAPHNLVSSTSALYAAGALHGGGTTPPPPVFSYGALPSTATPASSVNIQYPSSDLTWTWFPGQGAWSRSYAGTGPAALGDGGFITTTNVVVMTVVMYPSQYVEDPTGAHENIVTLTGSGPLQVLRNGKVISGTWRRPTLADTTQLVDANGKTIPLSPGPTWIELVPTIYPVTVTP